MSDPPPIPDAIGRQLATFHGEAGAAWAHAYPERLARLAERWSLQLEDSFPDIWYNFVAPGIRDGRVPIVLKVSFPNPELFSEIDALRLYDGRGAVRLLEVDEAEGAMLLERVQPGSPLLALADDGEATRIAARVMQQIWHRPPDSGRFPTVEGWAMRGMNKLRRAFDGGTGPFPRHLVERAESIFAELLPSMEERAVLHGDLHHWNILSAGGRGWLAIDPKGVVGEPAYETGAWLRNPNTTLLSLPDPGATLARRIAIFSEELGFDRQRIRDWGIAQAVLSAWWSYEDRTGGEAFGLQVAEILCGVQV